MMRRIDLLPESYVQRLRERRTITGVIVAGAIALLLLFGWFVLLTLQVSKARDELAATRERNAELQSEIAELQRFAELEAEIQADEAALATVMEGDLDWPVLFTEIATAVPGEVWLTNLTASAAGSAEATQVATETAAIPVSDAETLGRIEFTGRALSMPGVGDWLSRLAAVEDFKAVWLSDASESETLSGPSVIDFTSTLELNDGALSNRFQEPQP